MGKKDLKKQYPNLDISFIDYLSKWDPSGTNKYLPFLLKITSKGMDKNERTLKRSEDIYVGCDTSLDRVFLHLFSEIVERDNPLKLLQEFDFHLMENRVDNTDITSYESFDELLSEKNKADIKFVEKDMKEQTEKVYEDDVWLVIKPLSFRASKIYGSSTKWCTTMEHEPMYFYKYSRGILIYVINKKTNDKYGFYSGDDEYSVWNSADVRIDSLMTDIPFDILKVLQKSLDLSSNVRNRFLFSEDETRNWNKYFGEGKKKLAIPMPVHDLFETEEMVDMVDVEEPIYEMDEGEYMIMSEEIMYEEYPEIEEVGYDMAGPTEECVEGF